jgi:hypothetical protein
MVLRSGTQDIVSVVHERVSAMPGDIIHFLPDAASAHLFDEATGARLRA